MREEVLDKEEGFVRLGDVQLTDPLRVRFSINHSETF